MKEVAVIHRDEILFTRLTAALLGEDWTRYKRVRLRNGEWCNDGLYPTTRFFRYGDFIRVLARIDTLPRDRDAILTYVATNFEFED